MDAILGGLLTKDTVGTLLAMTLRELPFASLPGENGPSSRSPANLLPLEYDEAAVGENSEAAV